MVATSGVATNKDCHLPYSFARGANLINTGSLNGPISFPSSSMSKE
jgi:hypothetical protein